VVATRIAQFIIIYMCSLVLMIRFSSTLYLVFFYLIPHFTTELLIAFDADSGYLEVFEVSTVIVL